MRRNQVQGIIIHIGKHTETHSIADKVSEFHTDIIERRLSTSQLPMDMQLAVINRILENLKSREQNHIIK